LEAVAPGGASPLVIPSYGYDVVTIVGCGERETTIDAPPIDQNRASAALTVIATLLRPRKIEMFT